MKKKLLVAGLVAIVAIFSPQSKVWAQELTTNQIAILNKQAADAQQAANESELKALEAYAKLSPVERELRALEAEQRAAEFEKTKEIITPHPVTSSVRKQRTLSKTSMVSSANTSSVQTEGDVIASLVNGSSGGEQSLSYGGCGSDTHAFYNLPLFNASSGIKWQTENQPIVWYPWGIYVNDLDSSGKYAVSTLIPNSANITSAPLYIAITNNFDTHGVPLNHRFSFWYKFYRVTEADQYRISIGYGAVISNLPPTGLTWTRISIDVPAFPSYVTNSEIRATVYKTSVAYTAPKGDMYAPAWCTEIRPADVKVNITRSGANNLIWWSHEAAPTNSWQLIFSPKAVSFTNALWSTNIGVPVIVYSNTTAVATIPAGDSERYYALKRRF